MKNLIRDRLFTVVYLIIFALVILLACSLAGCNGWTHDPTLNGIHDPLIEPTLIDAMVETVTALTAANTASIPVNPYATPLNIGFAGIIAMLEALRRKEKAARKHAENGNHVTSKA